MTPQRSQIRIITCCLWFRLGMLFRLPRNKSFRINQSLSLLSFVFLFFLPSWPTTVTMHSATCCIYQPLQIYITFSSIARYTSLYRCGNLSSTKTSKSLSCYLARSISAWNLPYSISYSLKWEWNIGLPGILPFPLLEVHRRRPSHRLSELMVQNKHPAHFFVELKALLRYHLPFRSFLNDFFEVVFRGFTIAAGARCIWRGGRLAIIGDFPWFLDLTHQSIDFRSRSTVHLQRRVICRVIDRPWADAALGRLLRP